MKRRILPVILAIVMTFTLSVSAFATTYSDLTNHWAKTYMEDLAAKGYITGYSDGTMKPDKNITAGEMLVVLSRLYTLTDLQTSMIQADYETTVKGIVSSDLSWEYKYLETCLATGIITKDELKSLSLTANIQKEQLALYLVRAMQLSSDADKLASTKLTFADASKVLSACVGSVAELKAIGIVSGDASNNFSPQVSVTRAVAAKMVSCALTYMTTNGILLSVPAYANISQNTGIITAASSTGIDIRGYDGLVREFATSTLTDVTVNSVSKTLSSSYVGCYATITDQKGIVKSIVITSDSTITWIQGWISSFTNGSTSGVVTLLNAQTNTSVSYTIPSTAAITLDGATSTLSSVNSGKYITLKVISGAVTEAHVLTYVTSLTGTISTLDIASTVKLKITDSNGETFYFLLDMSNLPAFYRVSKVITIDKLSVGDSITFTFAEGKITTIAIAGSGTTVTGQVVSKTTTTDGTIWVLDTNGTRTSYNLDDDVTVYSGTKVLTLSDIDVGDQVSAVVFNSTITEIHLTSAATSATKVTGKVLSVSSTNHKISIKTSEGKMKTIDTSYVISMIVGSTGNSTTMAGVLVDQTVTAYGTYSDSTTFAAKTIIIE